MNKVWIGSPNFTQGRGGNQIQGVVMHWMAGNLASCDAVFQNRTRNTSAHVGIEDDNVHQYVKETDTAYQAGNWEVNQRTLSIEHSAQPGRSPSDATYETSAQLIAEWSRTFGFPVNSSTLRPHRSVVATQCPGDIANGGVDIERIIKRANEILGNSPAVVPPAPLPITKGVATVTTDELNVRVAPNTKAALGGSQRLVRGDQFSYTELVQGESVQGVSTWIHSTKGNYVWAGGTNIAGNIATTPPVSTASGGTAQAIRTAAVRNQPNTSAPLSGSRELNSGDQFAYSALVHGQNVSQNGVTTDLWYHSVMGNYVWSGNCKKV